MFIRFGGHGGLFTGRCYGGGGGGGGVPCKGLFYSRIFFYPKVMYYVRSFLSEEAMVVLVFDNNAIRINVMLTSYCDRRRSVGVKGTEPGRHPWTNAPAAKTKS